MRNMSKKTQALSTQQTAVAVHGVTPDEMAAVVRTHQARRSESTRRAYASRMRAFASWLRDRGQELTEGEPVTPEIAAVYLQSLYDGGAALSTIDQTLSAIHAWHSDAGLPSPRSNDGVREFMKGARRVHAQGLQEGSRKGSVQAEPAEWSALCRLVAAVDGVAVDTLRLRDRALLLMGMASGCRRAELAGMRMEHVEQTPHGLVITLPNTKTGRPRVVEITPNANDAAMCPVRAFRAWTDHAGITSGPLFRRVTVTPSGGVHIGAGVNGQAVARTVSKYADAAGLPPGRWSGHSLRAGYAVQATIDGVPETAIREQTGHTSSQLYVYTQRGKRFSVARNRYGSRATA